MSQRGVEVRHNAAARKLLTNINGEVVGVRTEVGEGQRIDIGANRGVMLDCGCFEFDERMKLNYLKTFPAYFYGSPANTGDGME
ncbi:MAG: FAD-binding protein [Dehalococcoidia bacterium]|nr:FAD-binding protein [Dehalococcoidia bacterium]